MYKGFNISVDEDVFSDCYDCGLEIHSKNKLEVKKDFESFLDKNGDLSVSKIVNEWFPSVDANVFLSHSHKDEEMVVALAGWLSSKFGIKSFIDSCVWGYSDDLLKSIDNKYCYNKESNTYSYERRNKSTAHVYVMLSTALARMIDACEAVFFVNTPNSISSADYIAGGDETLSPWIYSEIAMTSLVRERSLLAHRMEFMKKAMVLESADFPKFKYSLNISHLIDLRTDDLFEWEGDFLRSQRKGYPLDFLYKLKGF